MAARPCLGLLCAWCAGEALAQEPEEYGARIDPWQQDMERVIRIAKDQLLVLRLHRGNLTVAPTTPSGEVGEPMLVEEDEREAFLAPFPELARREPVAPASWAQLVARHAAGARVDPRCPVNGENHLERTVVEVFSALQGSHQRAMLNIGGLYGGARGDKPDTPDDPTVELLRQLPGARVLCWHCGDVAAVTRVGPQLAQSFLQEAPDLLSPDLAPPPDFRELDLLRLDFLPAGLSCRVLGRLLRHGARPRLVAMLVLSQVPPPVRFAPMAADPDRQPAALFSCSLAAAADVLAPYGLFLVRLTGPYALFALRDEWPEELPINDMECYRGAGVWGHRDLPLAFVREWLFSPVDDALPRIWGNITELYAAAGGAGSPFTLAA